MTTTLTADKKNTTVKILSLLCPLIYFASYMTRKNYSIVMADIIISEGITNADASLAATLSLISYGVGQIISGILGDKFKPQNIILCGLSLTTLMNILMPVADDITLRSIIWFINGFAQSMLWPPLVRIMAATMDSATYNKVCVNVNIAGISGTILLYITSSAIWIKYFNWKYVFISSAVVCAVILVIWLIGFKKAVSGQHLFEKEKKTDKSDKQESSLSAKKLLLSGFIFIAIAIIAQGALRDGITDWVPTFIINTFNLESSSAILKSVLIPVFGVISIKLVGIINGKFVKDEVKAGAVTFGMGLLGCVLLLLIYKENQYITLLLSALVTGLMHGVNFFLICIVPARFEKYNAVSTMSGIINSLTYVGSAAATYGFGAISDNFGWNTVIISWCVVAVIGTACCFVAVKPWKKFIA
ncbi:MAG: MFS transporter [Clostridia bacterium]|nr:MFS transporter [Clostridia bacterium]